VTVSLGTGDPGRRDRVLAALHQLITAAGPDIAFAGPDVTDAGRDGGVTGPGHAAGAGDGAAIEVVPGLRLDPGPRTLAIDGRRIELSRLEYDLLLFLVRHPSQVFSRNQLLAQVWGHTHTGARTVDVHVSRLRTKLSTDTEVIATVYGLGYRLADHVPVTVVNR
jgi:DNA-binding response OmpR family regulator